jgi:signal transduction histidine kinase
VLCIIDDGNGFSVRERGESRGLRYMRLRADLIGATISWSDNIKDDQPMGTVVENRIVSGKIAMSISRLQNRWYKNFELPKT